MDEGAVREIARLGLEAGTQVVTIGEDTYGSSNLQRIVPYEPVCQTTVVQTLTGFVDFITGNPDGLSWENDFMVTVDGPTEVSVRSLLITEKRVRETPLLANCSYHDAFPFGQFMSLEMFIIRLKSLFDPNDDLATLASFVARVTVADGAEITDDGVSQTTTVRKGTSGAVKEAQAAPAAVYLRPYRTFREIEQPESCFLFRLTRGNSGVQCALFEADGGRWQLDAVTKIKEYLKTHLCHEMLVIA